MTNLMTQLQETAQFIQSKIAAKADTAIILGSGLGNLSTKIETEFEIPYSSIPNFPIRPTKIPSTKNSAVISLNPQSNFNIP